MSVPGVPTACIEEGAGRRQMGDVAPSLPTPPTRKGRNYVPLRTCQTLNGPNTGGQPRVSLRVGFMGELEFISPALTHVAELVEWAQAQVSLRTPQEPSVAIPPVGGTPNLDNA
jgi:hypothetical protein